jgi:PAS domain S-box-containing protein
MKTLFEGKKLYAVIIVFLLMITFLITLHIIRNHYKYVFKNTITENTLTANLLSSLMYEYQKAATSILESYAHRPLFIDAVKKKDFHRALYHLKSLSEYHTEIDVLFITDQHGTVWANYPVSKESHGKNFAQNDWYKGVSKKWRPYISTLYQRVVLEKGLAVAIAVPVFDRKGKVIGILGNAQRNSLFATFIKANIIDPKKSITLLDQEGNIIFSTALPYQENITKYPDAHVLEKALAGVIIDMEIADAKEKGSISYVSIAPLRGIGWSVIVGQEKNAILKSLHGYFILSAATGFVIFLFLTVSLLYFRREYKYRKTKELLQVEEKYRDIFDNAVEGIYRTTPEGRFIIINPAFAAICGYASPEEIMEKVTDIPNKLYANPEDRLRLQKRIAAEEKVKGFEVQFKTSTRGLVWVSIHANALRDEQGNIRYYDGTIEDITERKRAEAALHLSEENFRRSLDDSPLGVRVVTIEGETIYANRAMLNIYRYDSIEELRTTPLKERYTPESYAEFQIRKEKRGKGEYDPFEYEISIVRKNGEVRHLQVFRKEILWNGERQFQTIYQDITDRKQAEVQFHASLREKETLLREVHHRVKNNMQVISGLLDLHASSCKNPELIAMFHESQSRIQAMALVHEKLYGSKDFARIDLAGYVRTLSQDLFQSYKINPGKIDLIVQPDVAVCVDINKAIPCGLILNELISNALKHAFPGDRHGELQIIIHETKNTEIEIVVRDNGLNLPDDFDIHEPRTVGLHLVNGLVKNQLDGQMEVSRDNGTEFRIKFPL